MAAKLDKSKLSAKAHKRSINIGGLDVYDHNALGYVEAVLNPWDANEVRFPDGNMHPTATAMCYTRFAMNPVTSDDAKAVLFGISAAPDPGWAYCMLSGAATADSGYRWSSYAQMPQYSSITAGSSYYRTLSMGIRLLNYGAAIKRGGYAYAGHYLSASTSTQTPGNSTPFTQTREATVIDAAELNGPNGEGTEIIWLPANTSRGGSYTVSGSNVRSALQWANSASVASPVTADPSVNFILVNTDPTNISDAIEVEIIMHVEFMPLQGTNEGLYPSKCAPGDVARVCDAMAPAMTSVNAQGADAFVKPHLPRYTDSAQGLDWGKIGGAALELAGGKTGKSIAKAALSIGQKFLPGFLGKASGFLGGLFAKKHRLAVALGMPQLSPLAIAEHLEHAVALARDDTETFEAYAEKLAQEVLRRRALASYELVEKKTQR